MMDISKEFWAQEIEKTTGQEIMMNTTDCVIYKMDNDTCKGCQHELNCAKLSSILSVVHSMLRYKPADFLDFMKSEQLASTMVDNIMNAKNVEEIEKFMRGE